jgi:tRNA A37 threonylcarbamoyladenosine synthetase subunit TsaC/SUA5/YrdC
MALLTELNEPLLTSTLILPGDDEPLTDADDIRERLEKRIDLVLDVGSCGQQMTTVINLVDGAPELIRAGKGSLAPFGLE